MVLSEEGQHWTATTLLYVVFMFKITLKIATNAYHAISPESIDNSGHSMIYTFYHNSETLIVILACDIPNKRGYFALSFDRSVIVIKFVFKI